jgi:hypothetical protein
VDSSPNGAVLDQALMVSHLRAWRTALLALHKALVDAELQRYGAAVGPVQGPHHALRLLSEDAWFAWLRPLLVLIVQIDERLADEQPLSAGEFETIRRETRAALQPSADSSSGREYQRALQELPAVVVLHGKLLDLTRAGRTAD